MFIRKFAPFSITCCAFLFYHRFLGWKRNVFHEPADKYLSQFAGQGLDVKRLDQDGTSPLFCKQCGFAMASVPISADLTLEACSATGLKGLVNNPRLKQLLASYSQPDEAGAVTAANLPTQGA